MTNEDEAEFLRDVTTPDKDDASRVPPKMILQARCLNPFEAEAKERAQMEVGALGVGLPMIFIDENGELEPPNDGKPEPWVQYFDGRIPKPWECAELAKELYAAVQQHPRVIIANRRIAIARDLGPRATKPQYEAVCKQEGIEP